MKNHSEICSFKGLPAEGGHVCGKFDPYPKEEHCRFEDNNICKALACYSKQSCSARDADGVPRYSGHKSMNDIKPYEEVKLFK